MADKTNLNETAPLCDVDDLQAWLDSYYQREHLENNNNDPESSSEPIVSNIPDPNFSSESDEGELGPSNNGGRERSVNEQVFNLGSEIDESESFHLSSASEESEFNPSNHQSESFDLLSASEESEISPLNHDGQESTVNEEGASTVATPVYHEAATEEPQEEYYGINDKDVGFVNALLTKQCQPNEKDAQSIKLARFGYLLIKLCKALTGEVKVSAPEDRAVRYKEDQAQSLCFKSKEEKNKMKLKVMDLYNSLVDIKALEGIEALRGTTSLSHLRTSFEPYHKPTRLNQLRPPQNVWNSGKNRLLDKYGDSDPKLNELLSYRNTQLHTLPDHMLLLLLQELQEIWHDMDLQWFLKTDALSAADRKAVEEALMPVIKWIIDALRRKDDLFSTWNKMDRSVVNESYKVGQEATDGEKIIFFSNDSQYCLYEFRVNKNSPSSSRSFFEFIAYLALHSLGQAPYSVHKTLRVVKHGIIVDQDANQSSVSLFLKADKALYDLSNNDINDSKDQDVKQVLLACQAVSLLGLQLADVKEANFVVDNKKGPRSYLFLSAKGKREVLECMTFVAPIDFGDCFVVGEMNTPGLSDGTAPSHSLCTTKILNSDSTPPEHFLAPSNTVFPPAGDIFQLGHMLLASKMKIDHAYNYIKKDIMKRGLDEKEKRLVTNIKNQWDTDRDGSYSHVSYFFETNEMCNDDASEEEKPDDALAVQCLCYLYLTADKDNQVIKYMKEEWQFDPFVSAMDYTGLQQRSHDYSIKLQCDLKDPKHRNPLFHDEFFNNKVYVELVWLCLYPNPTFRPRLLKELLSIYDA